MFGLNFYDDMYINIHSFVELDLKIIKSIDCPEVKVGQVNIRREMIS